MINGFCCDEFPEQVYATLVYLLFEKAQGCARGIIAGHPPLIRLSGENEITRFDSTIPPLGLFPDPPTEEDVVEFKVNSESRLVVYTDGVIETRNPAGEFFSTAKLISTMSSLHDEDIAVLPDRILEGVMEWRGKDIPPEDDVTILAMQRDLP